MDVGDGDGLGIDFVAAVFLVIEVGVAGHLPGGGVGGGVGIDWLGEGEFEAVGLSLHFLDFEGDFASELDAFEAEGAGALGVPAAVGFASDEGAVG